MRFWDSSAVVPLLVTEPTSKRVEDLVQRDPEMVFWWGTIVECTSAIARLHRGVGFAASKVRKAQEILEYLRERAYEVQPVEEVRARAQRLLAVHSLRAADALQLAAALLWCRERPRGVAFVSLDDRLRVAAVQEGFLVQPYSESVHEGDLDD